MLRAYHPSFFMSFAVDHTGSYQLMKDALYRHCERSKGRSRNDDEAGKLNILIAPLFHLP